LLSFSIERKECGFSQSQKPKFRTNGNR